MSALNSGLGINTYRCCKLAWGPSKLRKSANAFWRNNEEQSFDFVTTGLSVPRKPVVFLLLIAILGWLGATISGQTHQTITCSLPALREVNILVTHSLSGRTLASFEFSAAEPEGVKALSQEIFVRTGIPAHQQRLVLEDDQILRIRSGSWEPPGSLQEICPNLLL